MVILNNHASLSAKVDDVRQQINEQHDTIVKMLGAVNSTLQRSQQTTKEKENTQNSGTSVLSPASVWVSGRRFTLPFNNAISEITDVLKSGQYRTSDGNESHLSLSADGHLEFYTKWNTLRPVMEWSSTSIVSYLSQHRRRELWDQRDLYCVLRVSVDVRRYAHVLLCCNDDGGVNVNKCDFIVAFNGRSCDQLTVQPAESIEKAFGCD
jgi:hypothetical protein